MITLHNNIFNNSGIMNETENILNELIRSVPQRFKPERAKDFNGVFHFKLTGDYGREYTVNIMNGKCHFEEGLKGEPLCVLTSKAKTFVDAELGRINPQVALITGKIKVNNIPAMARFVKLFRRYTPGMVNDSDLMNKVIYRKPVNGPLVGLRILDFTRLLPGPLATVLMADMGAEVIKIENPHEHDTIRDYPPFIGDESANYHALNRSKRSVFIDYSNEECRGIMYKLVKTSDILFEQFRPGTMKRWGLDYDTLKSINPALIYVSLTGYGQTGPYASMAGHDLNFLAISGILGSTGTEGNAPSIPASQVADVSGSYMAVIGALSAVHARKIQGKGQHLDVSMLDSAMPLLTYAATEYWSTGMEQKKGEYFLSGGLPNYNVYECSDGKYIALASIEPKFWERFCTLVNKPEWKTRMLEEPVQRKFLKIEITELFKTKSRDEWVGLGENIDMCMTPVLEIHEMDKNKHLIQREMIIEQDVPGNIKLKSFGIPIKLSGTPAKPSWDAPAMGEDTLAVLSEIQVTPDQIRKMKEKDLIVY